MKKRLLLAAFALVGALSSFAYQSGDYVFTATQKLKVSGENLLTNGDFSQNFADWEDETGSAPSAETFAVEAGLGPNGEAVVTSQGATDGNHLTRNIGLEAGTYVISFWVRGNDAGTMQQTADANNYLDIFLTANSTVVKADGDVAVAGTFGYTATWREVTYMFTVEEGQSLSINMHKLLTGVQVANFSIYPVVEVYDSRIVERNLAYIDAIVATGKMENDSESFLDIVEALRAALDGDTSLFDLDDKEGTEDLLASFDEMLLGWLNENSSDMLKDEKRWSSYGDTRKENNFGNWAGSGGRWFHKNNGGGEGDEIGHRLQGGNNPGAASMHYTITPTMAGTYMFSVETQGYYMVSKSLNYTVDWDTPFNGTTFWAGLDTLWTDAAVIEASNNVKVSVDPLNHQYYETVVLFYDVTDEMVANKTAITFGMSYVPEANAPTGKGSNVQLRNPQLRLLGVDQAGANYIKEVSDIKTQQTVLVERIAEAQAKVAKTKADGFPWGHEALQEAIERADSALQASYLYINEAGEVINEDGIVERLQEDEVKVSTSVLDQVNNIKRAWQAYESLNASYTDLIAIADEAEAFLTVNAGKGNATRRAALEALVSEARAMIEATGAESEKEAFDAKKQEIVAAQADYKNSLTSYADPSEQAIYKNPETSSDSHWTFTANNTEKENFKKATQGAGWEAGYYTAVWRGNTASPQSKMVQTYQITDPGVYEFRVHATATNENFGYLTAIATIIPADEENGTPADTLYNKSEVKVFFGLDGAPDSVRVANRQRLATGSSNSGSGSALASFGYDADLYSVYYEKTGSDAVTVEFGMSTFGQTDKAGCNNYGFGDTHLFYLGETEAFKADMVADMTARINAVQAQYDNFLTLGEEEQAAAATWTSRLQRRLADAQAAKNATSTIKDLTALANATYFVEELGKRLAESENHIATSINTVKEPTTVQVAAGVYTLSGVKVAATTEGLKNLKSGLYIINGKKYVVK
ncbi:MAG: hypothetical protein IJV34_08325 [Prevotella sp.]|nr:hypothetical protein [Prevotella sp.]